MQHNFHYGSAGNWIAFLFGAMFNIIAHVVESGPVSYMVHAMAGGLIFLTFKMLGDLFAPLVHRVGQRLTKWLDNKID